MTPESLQKLITLYGDIETPAYVYETQMINKRITDLKASLGDKFKLFYSVKANPNPFLVSYIYNLVDGVEIASIGELYLALQAHVSPQKIIFVGPGKRTDELTFAIEKRIKAIVVESLDEILQIDQIAQTKNLDVSIMLRVNPNMENRFSKLKMGGCVGPFGISEEKLSNIFFRIKELYRIKLIGIQIYMGTQILDEEQIVSSFINVLNLAIRVQSFFKLEIIDFGGGFGVPYYVHDHGLNMTNFKQKLQKELFKLTGSVPGACQFIVEAGRYIVAECGTFIVRVLYKKQSHNRTYLIVDGGSNFHAAAAGIGRVVRHNFPITVYSLNEDLKYEKERVQIVGPLCTPTDIIAADIDLPETKPGDYVLIHKSGAYGLSYSATHFLGHPTPSEILVDQDKMFVIKKKGGKEELYNFYMSI